MSITAKYLSSVLNTESDRESRKKPDFSDWLLHPKAFQVVSSQGMDTMMQNWSMGLPYAFPAFNVISVVLLKVKLECVPLLNLTAPVGITQPWYLELLNHSVNE